MAVKGIQYTVIRSAGWVLVLIGLMFLLVSCDQYYVFFQAAGRVASWGITLGVIFVTFVCSFFLVSLDISKVGNFDVPKLKRVFYVAFAVLDVILIILGLVFDQLFAFQGIILLIAMVTVAAMFRLELDQFEKRKPLIGLIFLAVEIALLIMAGVVFPIQARDWVFYAFLIAGITGVVGWDTLLSIFRRQKLRSIILLSISFAFGIACAIGMMVQASLPGSNLLGPIFVALGLFIVLGIEQYMQRKNLLIYVK